MTNPFRGPNSVPISQLPDKVKDISNDDLTILSIHDKTGSAKTTGLGTMSGFNQTLMGKYRTNHLANMVAVNIPTDFTGTPSNFGLNRQPLDDRYISAKHFPFSSIGAADEFSLPISGSYFGVNSVYGTGKALPVVYAEDNGDYTVLKHVTNGEDFRWTYSFLDLEKNTMRNTDIEYRPVGLENDEYVGYVHAPNNDVMVIEIHSKTNFVERLGFFKEWAVVTLNGTLNHKQHTLQRVGTSFTRINRTATRQIDREKLRTTLLHTRNYGLNATKYDNKYWYVIEVDNELTGRTDIVRAIEVWSAPLANPGLMTLDPDFTSIGPAGLTGNQRDGKPLILYTELSTTDNSNKNAMYLVSHAEGSPRPQRMNSNTRAVSLGYSEDHLINVITYYYTDIFVQPPNFPTRQTFATRQICFLKLDLRAKRLYTDPVNGNQRQQISFDTSNPTTVATGLSYPSTGNIVPGGHYWAGGIRFIQLSNKAIGEVLFDQYTSVTITRPNSEPFNIGRQRLDGAVYSYLSTPPTVHKPLQNVIMFYDKAMIISEGGSLTGSVGNIWDRKYLLNLEGRRTYKLRASGLDNPTVLQGYNIPSERTELPHPLHFNPTTVVDMVTNTPTYGGATFTSYMSEAITLPEYLDANGNVGGRTFKLSPNVREKLTELTRTTRAPFLTPAQNETYNAYWCCSVFTHAKFTYLIIKVRNSFKTGSDPTNLNKTSDSISVFLLARYTTTNEGGVTVISDFTVLTTQLAFTDQSGYNTNTGNMTCGVLAIYRDKAIYHFRNHGGSGTLAGGDFAGAHLNSVIFTIANGVVNPNPSVINYNSAGHPHGLFNSQWMIPSYSTRDGIVATSRIMSNTFVVATKLNPETGLFPRNTAEQSLDNLFIVATPRPRDGFSFTINTPIDVYMLGRKLTLPVNTYDLTSIKANPRNTTFYLTVVLANDRNSVSLNIATSPPREDTETSMYIGHIVTTDIDIKEIVTEPVVRWDATRPSTTLIGSAFPCSTGHPFEQNSIEWYPGIKPPKASYNATGTVITGTTEPGVTKVQFSLGDNAVFGEARVTGTNFSYTVQEPHNFVHNLTPYVNTPAHTSGQTVLVRGVIVNGDGSETFTASRRIKAPLIPAIVFLEIFDSENLRTSEIVVDEQYKLVVWGVGLSNEDKEVDLEIDWTKIGFDPSWIIEHDHNGKIPFNNSAAMRWSRIWRKVIMFRVKKP